MKRTVDLVLVALLIPFLLPAFFAIAVAVRATSRGPVLYWSERIGKDNTPFNMPKFRTMVLNTPPVATHLLQQPDKYLTSIGSFLRKSSLDEIPQVLCVLRGEMSFVGPRPALFNQHDLIRMRTENGVHRLLPGITGLAQITGRDELSVEAKVKCDESYLVNRSLGLDLKILCKTGLSVLTRKNVVH